MNSLKYVKQAAIHILCFVVVFLTTLYVFSHSSSKLPYAFLNAWWFSLYIGRFSITGMKPFFFTLFLAFIFLLVVFLSGNAHYFYHGVGESLSITYTVVMIVQSVIIASPILLNVIVQYLSKRVSLD